jgi:nucleoside-diphosphate-sugar epimerase
MKNILVLGAGFIGSNLAIKLASEGNKVRVVDVLHHTFDHPNIEFMQRDLRWEDGVDDALCPYWFNEVYLLASNMGGAGWVFSGKNDANILIDSIRIGLNLLDKLRLYHGPYFSHCKLFFASSACIYPQGNQLDSNSPTTAEHTAWPADPDSCYGLGKLLLERTCEAYTRNHGLDIRIARFHNIFGPLGCYDGGKEKAPAAIIRKVINSTDGTIEVWGDGEATRSFLYIDECLDGVARLMASDYTKPINIGSSEMVSINQLVDMVAQISGKTITKKYIPGPQGVRGRNSDNTLIKSVLNWSPSQKLYVGLEKTYKWIESEINKNKII